MPISAYSAVYCIFNSVAEICLTGYVIYLNHVDRLTSDLIVLRHRGDRGVHSGRIMGLPCNEYGDSISS